MFNFKLLLCLSAVFALGSAYVGQVDRRTLKFKCSAFKLDDKDTGFGTSDPYLILAYTENGGTRETRLGRTETIDNSENPVWSYEFEFAYDRSKNQELHFMVWDSDNLVNPDDELGRGWISANDYVDKGQLSYVPLYKKGYVRIQRVDLTAPAAPRSWPQSGNLSFQIAATGLPDKDPGLGTIDPYAIIELIEGMDGRAVQVGRTSTISNQKNPSWGERFSVRYDGTKNQRLVIKIYDDDTLRQDERGGFGYVDLEDYMRNGQLLRVRLSKGGFLTIKRA